jgi:hypothetical protein
MEQKIYPSGLVLKDKENPVEQVDKIENYLHERGR